MTFLTPAQGLDSAIVDCGKAMLWSSYEDDVSVGSGGRFLPTLLAQPLFILSRPVVPGAVIEKDQKNLGIVTSG